jgi:hypothetical protein
MDYFTCPACNRKATLKAHVPFAGKIKLYYGCKHDSCRHHFQVLRMDGWADQIVAESPREGDGPRNVGRAGKHAAALMLRMVCPSCARYGKVKTTTNRRDGYWRRHECPTDGPYYSCTTVDGVSVHRKLTSLKVAEDIAHLDLKRRQQEQRDVAGPRQA